jgi:hypothetical protein
MWCLIQFKTGAVHSITIEYMWMLNHFWRVLLHIYDVDSAGSKLPLLTGMKYFCFSNRQFDSNNAFFVSVIEKCLIILTCIMFCTVLFNGTVYCYNYKMVRIRWMNEHGALAEWWWWEKTGVLGKKSCSNTTFSMTNPIQWLRTEPRSLQ